MAPTFAQNVTEAFLINGPTLVLISEPNNELSWLMTIAQRLRLDQVWCLGLFVNRSSPPL